MPPEFVQWLQNTTLATAIRESALVFPVILSLHLTGMGLFGGMILMTDLRILGIAMTKRPVSEVVNGLRPWKHLGLTLTASCGILLAVVENRALLSEPVSPDQAHAVCSRSSFTRWYSGASIATLAIWIAAR